MKWLSRLSRPAVLLGLSLSGFRCGGVHPPASRSTVSDSTTSQVTDSSHVSERGRWVYRPVEPASMSTSYTLDEHSNLLIGKLGERWLIDDRVPKARSSASLAPGGLIAMAEAGPRLFRFVDDLGRIYQSNSPLGALRPVSRLPEGDLYDIASVGSHAVVLVGGRVFVSSDYLETFSPIRWSGAMPQRVKMGPSGRAMLLAYPEQLWLSEDFGQTWKRSSLPPVGAAWLSQTPTGGMFAVGELESVVWPSDSEPRVLEVHPGATDFQALIDNTPGLKASWFLSQQATFWGRRYIAAATSKSLSLPERERGSSLWIASGYLSQIPDWQPMPSLGSCSAILFDRLSDSPDMLLGCLRPFRKDALLQKLSLFAWGSASQSLTSLSTGLIARNKGTLAFYVSPSDALVINACVRQGRELCAPNDFVHLRLRHQSRRLALEVLETSRVPRGTSLLGIPTVCEESETIYAMARMDGEGGLRLLRSTDNGASFRGVGGDLSTALQDDKLGYELGKLTCGNRGKLSWLVATKDGKRWVVLDEKGNVRSVNKVSPDRKMSVVGERGLSVADDGRVFESLDGGKSFHVIGHVRKKDVKEGVVCCADGCVLGGGFTRLGWGAPEGQLQGVVQVASEQRREHQPKVRIRCEVESLGNRIPADPATLASWKQVSPSWVDWGDLHWAYFDLDRNEGRATAMYAYSKAGVHSVELSELQRSSKKSAQRLIDMSYQSEGVAIGSFDTRGDGRGSRRVDVTWVHLGEGREHHGHLMIPDLGSKWTARNKKLDKKIPWRSVNFGQLSVSHGGIFICPYPDCLHDDVTTWFVPNQGRPYQVPRAQWPDSRLDGRKPAVTPGYAHYAPHRDGAWGMDFNRWKIFRSMPDGSVSVMALKPLRGLGEPYYTNLRWVYLADGHNGLVYQGYGRRHSDQTLALLDYRFESKWPQVRPLRVPTDVTKLPACAAKERKEGVRMPVDVVEPIGVTLGGDGKHVVRLDAAVLYYLGSRGFCLGTLVGNVVTPDRREGIVIRTDQLDSSWLITLQVVNRQPRLLEKRMRCVVR